MLSQNHKSAKHPNERVSVVVDGHTVPLLPGAPTPTKATSPWSGLVVEKNHLAAVEIPEHEHHTFCLHLQSSSPVAMDWRSFGRTGHIRSGPGDLILLAPGTRDSMTWYGSSDRIVVSLDPTLLQQAADHLNLKGPIDFANNWSFQDPQLALLLTEMEREKSTGWANGSLYADTLSLSLSTALLSKYGQSSAHITPLKGGLSSASLRRVLSYIEANLHRDLRLQELASIADLSIFHFARSFRESTSGTPHQYITQRRLQIARALLHKPQWTVQQIASAIGFTDAGQFAKLFKRNTGVTPTEWRQAS